GLPRFLGVVRTHGPKFVNLEPAILHSGPDLNMKERAGRLNQLRQPDDERQDWEDENHYGQRNCDVDRALKETVQRVFQRLFAQPDETETVIFKMRHRMAEFFLEIAHDQEPDADTIAHLDDLAIVFREERELEHDHLRHAAVANDFLKRGGIAEHRNSIAGLLDRLVR